MSHCIFWSLHYFGGWPYGPCGHLHAEYYLDRGLYFLIRSRDDWDPNKVVHPEHMVVYIDGSKLDNGIWIGIYSGKLDLSDSFRLTDYCSVFQAEVMTIYRVACLDFLSGRFSVSLVWVPGHSNVLRNCRIVFDWIGYAT